MTKLAKAYTKRTAMLSEEMDDYITSLVRGNVPPADILTCLQLKFRDAPPVTPQDIVNLNKGYTGGSRDAFQLLSMLQEELTTNPDWFIR